MGCTLSYSVKQSGSVLIVALTLSLVIGLIVILSLENNILLGKITKNFHEEALAFMDAEKKLSQMELSFHSENGNKTDKYSKIQFVADTLAFGESQGIDFYKLEIEYTGNGDSKIHLQSIVSVRH